MNLTMAKRDAKPFEMSKPAPASTVRPSVGAEGTLNGNEDNGLYERSYGSGVGFLRDESVSQRRFFTLSSWTSAGAAGTMDAK